LRSQTISPSTSRSSPDSEESRGLITTMNNQPEGVGNMRDNIGNDEDPHLNGAVGEPFMPRMLLDYAASRAIDAKGSIRLPCLTRESSNYDASTINIL
jgi:hypothetical protein